MSAGAAAPVGYRRYSRRPCPAEREAVLTTLDEEVAAEALEEVEPKLQKHMVESLDSEVAAASRGGGPVGSGRLAG